VMRTADELRDPRKLAVKTVAPRKNEIDMARALIEQMSAEWDPRAHPNVYRKAMQKLVASKRAFELPAEEEAEKPTRKVVDLVDALKRSLDADRKRPARTARKKSTRSRRAA